MERIRTRWYLRPVLPVLLIILSVFFAENRIEAFVPGNEPIEPARIEKAVPVGGALLDYSIPDMMAEIRALCAGASFIGKGSTVSVDFATHDDRISGSIVLKGSLANLAARGAVYIKGNGRYCFNGSLKGERFTIEVSQGAGSVRASGSFSAAGGLSLKLKAENAKICGRDVCLEARVDNRTVMAPGAFRVERVEGRLEAFGITVDSRRIPDISTGYVLADKTLKVERMKVGKGIIVSGSLELDGSKTAELLIKADNLSLGRAMIEFGACGRAPDVAGTLNGRFLVNGPLSKPAIDASFDVRLGRMGDLDFESLSAKVSGRVPFIKIDDAFMIRRSGRMELSGEFDMRNIGRNSFFSRIETRSDDAVLAWDDVSEDRRGSGRLDMSKNLTSDIGLRYRRYARDEKIDESVRDSDRVRLEYRLGPNDSLGLMLGADQDFLGFEHRDRF